MVMKKKQTRFWLALVIFSLVGQIAWVIENMYFNVFIYQIFHATAAEISIMVAASAVAATLTTILIGALSDKLGKRKLFICGGYILWGISIASFALLRMDLISKTVTSTVQAASVGVSLVIIMDCIMTFFGSTANDACFNAWLTDSTTTSNRGAAEGINAMMPLIAILVVFGGFMSFDLKKESSWTVIYLITGTVVSVIGIIGLFLIEESRIEITENTSYFRNILYGFRLSVLRENKILYLTLLAFAVFGISIQIFMPYLILYYSVSLGMDNYVLIMAPAIILAAVVTAFYGRLYDKVHFSVAVFPSLVMLITGYLFLGIFTNTPCVFIGSLLMMSGYLSGMAVFGAMIRDYTPENKAGMFQGLRIVGQVLIPGIIGPWIGAKVLHNAQKIVNDDGTQSFIPNAKIFFAAMIAAIFIFVVLLFLIRLLKKEKTNGKV